MPYECYCDYDLPQFHETTYVKRARKEHRCDECGFVVPPGEPYRRDVGKWEDRLETLTMCARCDEMLQWATISVPCFCYSWGSLHLEVREMVDAIRFDVPGVAFEWGRRMVRIKGQNAPDSKWAAHL